jgi:hypothetical protein
MEIKINVPQHILEIWNLLTLQYPDYGRGLSLEDLTASLKLYARLLADVAPELLKAATLHHIATSKWFPKVSELREAALALIAHDELSCEEAWGEVRQAIQRFGSYGVFDQATLSYRLPTFSHPLIDRAVQIMGWRNLCASDNEVADRAHFWKVYSQLVNRRNFDAMMLPEVRRIVETLSMEHRLQLPVRRSEANHD